MPPTSTHHAQVAGVQGYSNKESDMKIIKPYFSIEGDLNGDAILKRIERAGRTCYKSEAKITADSCREFVRKIVASGHESVLEHENITVRIVCDRGVSHEIVRHRLASYSQESTRYCNYGKKGSEITFIAPIFWKESVATSERYRVWRVAMANAEEAYLHLLAFGASPQEARSVLPNSLKTEIVMTCNLREWRHFFRLRAAAGAHPQMREIAVPMLRAFQELIPVVFDDLLEEG
jgi:thymidylate synthase (FAD)